MFEGVQQQVPGSATVSIRSSRPELTPTAGFGSTGVAPSELAPVSTDLAQEVDALLSNGFRGLLFEPELERRFLTDTAPERLRVIITAAILLVILFTGHLLGDKLMIPDMFEQAVVLRLGIFLPLCLMGLYFQIRFATPYQRELLIVAAGLLATAIFVYLCVSSHDPMAPPYLTGLSMVVLFSNSVAQMRFWLALAMDSVFFLVYVWAGWLTQDAPIALMISGGIVMLSTITFTLVGCYSLERDERQNWLLRVRTRHLMTALEQANDRLEKISRSDLLTEVANRRHFDDFLTQVWARAQVDGSEVSILMLDVDHFKAFNDHYGHPVGDECLKQVAATLKRRLRRPGDLVARFGGEEFIAVLTGTSASIATQAAERIRLAIENMQIPHLGSQSSSFITTSIGVACLRPRDAGATQTKLISLADEALYKAKSRGRNRVCCSSGEDAQA